MNRWSWGILAVLVLALGVYAFRPSPPADPGQPFLTIQAGTAYTLTAGGLTQVVAADRVTINGIPRTLDPERSGPLWGTLQQLRVDPARIITGVRLGDLAGYGLDQAAELTGSTPSGPIHLRWGRSGEQAYLWDGLSARLAAVDPGLVANLQRLAGRLDQQALVGGLEQVRRLVVDGTVFLRTDQGWSAELQPVRPALDGRIQRLLGLLAGVTLKDLAAPPALLAPVVGRIELGLGPDARTITLLQTGDGLRLVLDRLPPQVLPDATIWAPALAALQQDVLLDLRRAMPDVTAIEAVRLTRGGQVEVALERGEMLARSQDHRWEVVWPGGREPAARDAIERVLGILDDLRIRDPMATAGDPTTSSGMVVTVVAENDRLAVALEDDGTIRSATHAGRLVDPARLRAAFDPAALLDPRLSTRKPQRIAKIQRRVPAEQRAEVLTRADGGTWSRTWPAPGGAVDGPAVDRLVRQVASARYRTIRLAQTVDDRARAHAILARPDAELALRFAPAEVGQAANDETDLDETASQDWGLALVRTGDGWEGTDSDAALLVTLDVETVEGLLAPVEGGRLFPLVPAAVTALEASSAAGPWRITRTGDGWDSNGRRIDNLAVRRLLRTLASLPGAPDARIPEPAAPVASLTAEVPSLGGESERLRLLLTADGLAWVGSDRIGSAFPRGGGVSVPPGLVPALADLLASP